MYTMGTWTVKKGREDEFMRRWQESADGASLRHPDVTFKLFRAREHPERFVSLDEGMAKRRAHRGRSRVPGVPGLDCLDLASPRIG